MEMDKAAILRWYEQGTDKEAMIETLAKTNNCERSEIEAILRDAGKLKKKGGRPKKVETPEAAIKEAVQPEAPEAPRIIRPVDKTVIVLEDVLDLVFSAVDDYVNAPPDREVFSEGAFVGYLSAVRDTYAAIYGPIVR